MAVTLPPEQPEILARTLPIFYPHAARRREHLVKNNGRFVHYTSAAAALSIINTKRFWMRNTTCMIDYREVQHGLDALNRLFGVDKHKTAFVAALDECFPNSAQKAFTRFDKWWQNTLAETQPLNAY